MTPDPSGPRPPWLRQEELVRLDPMLELMAQSHASLSSVTELEKARMIHVADSLTGLACAEVREASRVLDLGAGAGFPGIPLALFMPEAEFTELDSVGRKVEFMNQAISALGLKNARAIQARSESWAGSEGGEAYDLVTARAVAPLAALAELASPLLQEGGHLVAWKGDPEPEDERKLSGIADQVAMKLSRQQVVVPFEGSRERRLYVLSKTGPTPEALPRRAGMARKRPLGGR